MALPVVSDPAALDLSPTGLEELWAAAQDLVELGRVHGVAIALARHGTVLVPRTFGTLGHGPSRPLRPNDIFMVASVSKPVAAVAVVKLIEQGRLELTTPLVDILPEFAGGPTSKRSVTMFHLLTHTSGLPGWFPAQGEYVKAERPWKDWIQATCDCDLEYIPGHDIKYQSPGFDLIGEIVLRITGQSLQEFMEVEIFTPLGMRETSCAHCCVLLS